MNSQNNAKRIIEVVLTTTILAVGFYVPQGLSSTIVANNQCGADTGLPCRLQGGGTRMLFPSPNLNT